MQHESRRRGLGQLGHGEPFQLHEDRADRTQGYRTRDEIQAEVFHYIERFHNPTRRHSTLGYVSPIEFEKARRA